MQRSFIDYTNLLKETIVFYMNNPRGINPLSGLYTYYDARTGHKCAVGRCVKFDELHGLADTMDGLIDSLGENGVDKLFQDQYKGFNPYFWCCIQNFHDSAKYWSGNSLTEEGIKNVLAIERAIEEYCDWGEENAFLTLFGNVLQ